MKFLFILHALVLLLQASTAAPAVASINPPSLSGGDRGLHSRWHENSRFHRSGHKARRMVLSREARFGVASFYGEPQRLASGGCFNSHAMTAAHKTLPFGTQVRVTHLGTGRSVDVRINDRGPYVAGRIIDLSKAAAGAIGMTNQGTARIKMTVLSR